MWDSRGCEGESTEEELYIKFLSNFETNGLNGKYEEATVGDGQVKMKLILSSLDLDEDLDEDVAVDDRDDSVIALDHGNLSINNQP